MWFKLYVKCKCQQNVVREPLDFNQVISCLLHWNSHTHSRTYILFFLLESTPSIFLTLDSNQKELLLLHIQSPFVDIHLCTRSTYHVMISHCVLFVLNKIFCNKLQHKMQQKLQLTFNESVERKKQNSDGKKAFWKEIFHLHIDVFNSFKWDDESASNGRKSPTIKMLSTSWEHALDRLL